MKEIDIRLSLAENVKAFVNVVSRFDYEMDLQSGRHVVDAKSILGIFSLDLFQTRQADCAQRRLPAVVGCH